MHLVIYDLSDQFFAFSSKFYQLSDISIESLKKLTSLDPNPNDQILVASYLDF